MEGLASVDDVLARAWRQFRPPPRLRLDEWADVHFRLSAESSAEPGRWTSLPYQRAIMQAVTAPGIERITWMKSARVGATKVMMAALAYHMTHDPCSLMIVQPTIEDAEGFSKDEVVPMLRDVPALRGMGGGRDTSNTMRMKSFPGGKLLMEGANSGRGFRRVSVRVIMFDEVDEYPASAGEQGDPITLGIKRTETFATRKIIAAST